MLFSLKNAPSEFQNIMNDIFNDYTRFFIVYDYVFSTETRLERAGIARPVRWLWTSGSSAKIRNKMIGANRLLPLRCLCQFSLVEEKINYLRNEFLCIPFTDGVTWYL